MAREPDQHQQPDRAAGHRHGHQHLGEFAREFGEQSWVDMDEDETANWRKVLADPETAAATFRRTVNLIS